jgi:hypothetical protein
MSSTMMLVEMQRASIGGIEKYSDASLNILLQIISQSENNLGKKPVVIIKRMICMQWVPIVMYPASRHP